MPKYTVRNPPPATLWILALIFYSIRRDVAKAQGSDFWDVREGEGLNEEDLDQLLKDQSDRCVSSLDRDVE